MDAPILGRKGCLEVRWMPPYWEGRGCLEVRWMGQGAGYSPAEQSFQTGFHQEAASACWFLCQSGQLFPGVGVGTLTWGVSTRSAPSVQVA